MNEGDRIVVLTSYNSLIEAEIVKGRLQASGIECFISDTQTSLLYPFYAEQSPGVRLNILQKDAERAMAILREDATLDSDMDTSYER